MSKILTPTQEHYLKREFLKFQLAKELNDLNNRDALRRFGFPFTDKDPKLKSFKSTDNKNLTFYNKQQSIINTQFPLCSYLLREFIMTFPLVSKNIEVDQVFWQEKVQIFFEHFMSLGFSESYDREKSTKRKKIGLKLTKIILLLFNSGIGVSDEVEYYSTDKFQLNKDEFRKRSKVEEFAIPTMETLKQLVTHKPIYINNWDINIVGCVKERNIFKNRNWKKSQSVKNKSYSSTLSKSTQALTSGTIKSITSTSKWMKNTLASTTPTSIFAKLSINGNDMSSFTGTTKNSDTIKLRNDSHSSKLDKDSSNHKYWFIIKVRNKEKPNEIIYSAKTYKDFKILSHNLKMELPGKKLPKLPEKTKQSLSLTTNNELLPNGRVPDQPKETIVSSMEIECGTLNSTLNSTQNSINDDDNIKSLKQNEILIDAKNIVNNIIENEGINDGKDIDTVEDEVEDELEEEDIDGMFEDASDAKTNTLVHEKMRTSLRQYLRRLSNDRVTSENIVFVNFLSKQNIIDGTRFNKEVEEDIRYRELVDINNLTNQLKFQKLALQKSLELQDSVKDFKSSLLRDEKYLLSLVNEIREKKCIEELSPLLQQFIEWFKVYLSSIIYQLFLGNDNSYGFYTQIKKLHRIMPYTMMGQIMRFTNPISIMKGMMDLFLAQPFGNNSLLQTMFSTILTEDLKSQTNVIKKLETIILKESKHASQIINVLKTFIEMDHLNHYRDDKEKSEYGINEDKTTDRVYFNIERIHEESRTMNMPMCLIILMKYSESKTINNEAVTEVIESYNGWKLKEDSGLYFQHINELFQLYIKERDKRLMRKLWQDPELSKLLKAIVTMIYEPMIKLFKIARMDIALKNFEMFMNDLIKLMDEIISGQLENSTEFNIIENIIQLLTKHQNSLFEFVHDVYNNDTEGIFEGFIKWITKIIRFLQCSKYGSMDGKERIDLNKLVIEKGSQIHFDVDTLKKQIDSVIEKKMESRRLYRKLVESKIKSGEPSDESNVSGTNNTKCKNPKKLKENTNIQQFMDQRWRQVTSNVIPDHSISLGLQDGELVDLDLDIKDYEYLQENKNTELEQKYKEILNKPIDESLIEQMTHAVFEPVLKQWLL